MNTARDSSHWYLRVVVVMNTARDSSHWYLWVVVILVTVRLGQVEPLA